MTSHEGKCDLTSILSMSCHQRAQAFADRLRSRLTSLDSEELNGTPHETSWLSNHKDSVALSQPKHNSEFNLTTNFYLNLVSPGSPVDETDSISSPNSDNFVSITNAYQNRDDLLPLVTSQYDSDSSDGPFYDCQGDLSQTAKIDLNISRKHNHDKSEEQNSNKDVTNGEKIITNGDAQNQNSDLSLGPVTNGGTIDNHSCLTNGERVESFETPPSSRGINGETLVENSEIHLNGTENTNNLSLESSESSTQNHITSSETHLNGTENSNTSNLESSEKETPKQNHIRSDVLENDVDENEAEEQIPRVRRCSSLKTGKTPPGTPGRKKIVRFADVFGLDLADVRTFLDEIPKIPNSAFNDLVDVDIKPPESDLVPLSHHCTEKILVPLFQQPGSLPNFIDRLRDNHVCLDCAVVEDPTTCLIRGVVRVQNLDFHKSVHIRYSLDSWLTFTDVQALYVENSCDGFSDKFSFILYANNVQIGEKIEFAVRFQCKGCQYWDNNNGINYIFQSLPGSSNTTAAITALDDRLSTFY